MLFCHCRRRSFWQSGLEPYAWFGAWGKGRKRAPEWTQLSLVMNVLQSVEGLETSRDPRGRAHGWSDVHAIRLY